MKSKVLRWLLFISLIFCVIFGLTACGEDSKNNNSNTNVSESSSKEGFLVKYDGVNVAPGSKFDESKISEEATISEIPSCAFEGTDKVYSYSGVEITVCDIDGVPTVYSVYFLDDTISTEEGVKISDSKDLMIEKYGQDYENSLSNKFDYKKGKVILSFIVENDNISGIEYTLITNN